MTNEKLRGICVSNFELANYAIGIGLHNMRAGHEMTLGQILQQVRKHPDPSYLQKLEEIEKITEDEV